MKRRMGLAAVLLGLLAVVLTGCWLFREPAEVEHLRSDLPREKNPQVDSDELRQLVEGNREFALDLYQVLRKEEGNLFYSPYSISSALAMTYAGARGTTERELADTLHFDLEQGRLHAAFNYLYLDLNRRPEEHFAEGEFELTVANSLWGQQGYPFEDEFLDVLAENYGAGVRAVDFMSDPDACRRAINEWVSNETNGRIDNLIAPGALSCQTRLVLANTIFLKALWPVPFEEELTVERPFKLLDGGEVMVPTMEKTLIADYAEGNGYQAIRLPVKGACSVFVIVPEESEFREFEKTLDAGVLRTISDSLEWHEVDLFMPKFSYSSRFELREALSSLGAAGAFSPGADFSGITTAEDLWLDDVVHESFVGVDEYGIVAGGATATLLVGSPPPPPPAELRIDRPFIFFIQDDVSGTILFMGRVTNPLQS